MLHPGERAVQELAGEAERGRQIGRMLSPVVPDRLQGFLEQQHWLTAASIDADGRPWASVWLGSSAGWAVVSPVGDTVRFDLRVAPIHPADVLDANLRRDPRLAILALELESRRRMRVNGRVTALRESHLEMAVEQAFPNCPKYIQRRNTSPAGAVDASSVSDSASVTDGLSDDQRALIRLADTCLVASVNRDAGADASHRGGAPGFVRCDAGNRLRIADYPGNSMFNTLGNIHRTPRAGLTFVDFDTGRVLQLTGEAALDFGPAPTEAVDPTGGTGRWWTLDVVTARDWQLPAALGWSFVDASPFNPPPADSTAD